MTTITPYRGLNRVIVIGAGVIGATVAARLAERGTEVLLLSAEEAGSTPATRAAFGWVNALPKPSAEFQRLNEDGRRAHAGRSWFTGSGATADGVDYPEDGYVDTHAYLAAQLAAVRAASGEVRTAAVRDLSGVREQHGPADAVVVAAGEGTAALLAQHPHSSTRVAKSAGTDGFVARIEVGQHPIDRILSLRGLQVRPDGEGRIAAQSLQIEADHRERGVALSAETVWAPLRTEIAEKWGWEAPETAAVRVDHARRVHPADGLPLIGRLSGDVYVALTHSGITLAPLLGDLIARDLSGDPDPRLASFRP